jgi:hypothetical protein
MQDDRIYNPGDFYPILDKAKVMRDHIWSIVLVKYKSLTEMTMWQKHYQIPQNGLKFLMHS